MDVKEVTIHLGTVHLKPKNDSNLITLKSKEFIIHENFDESKNNIALIKLPKPVKYTQYIQPAKLLSKGEILGRNYKLGFSKKQCDSSKISESLKFNKLTYISCELFMLKESEQYICMGDSYLYCSGDRGGKIYFKQIFHISLKMLLISIFAF